MLSNHKNARDLIFVSEKLSNSVSSTTTAARDDDTKKVVRLRKLPNELSNTSFWKFHPTRKITADMLSRYGYGAGSGQHVMKYGVLDNKVRNMAFL